MSKDCDKCKEREKADTKKRFEEMVETGARHDRKILEMNLETDKRFRQSDQRRVAGFFRRKAEHLLFETRPSKSYRLEVNNAVLLSALSLYVAGLIVDSEVKPSEHGLRLGVTQWFCGLLGYSEEEAGKYLDAILPPIMAAEAEFEAQCKKAKDELEAKIS